MKATRTISLWKCIGLSAFLLAIFPISSNAQCVGSLQTLSYDTLVHGTGNDPHTFTLSKFDPAIGTLSEVKISSVVSVNYGFSLTNTDNSAVSFSVGVGRKDNVQSTVLSSPYNNTIIANIGTFLLQPNETISEAPTTVINRYDNDLSASSDIINFVGNDGIDFNYAPRTYASHSGTSGYIYSGTADDTIHFSVTYVFCNGIILAQDLTNFSALKQNDETVRLDWSSSLEQQGRTYEIQKSADAIHFSPVGSVASNLNQAGGYLFDYATAGNEKIKLWFRLKINDASGVTKYSTVKMVDMTTKSRSGIFLYPNPSDQFVNIVFNQPKNYQVDIYASNGVLLQRENYNNVNTAHVNFNHPLPAGTYFARITEQQTLKNNTLAFVVK